MQLLKNALDNVLPKFPNLAGVAIIAFFNRRSKAAHAAYQRFSGKESSTMEGKFAATSLLMNCFAPHSERIVRQEKESGSIEIINRIRATGVRLTDSGDITDFFTRKRDFRELFTSKLAEIFQLAS